MVIKKILTALILCFFIASCNNDEVKEKKVKTKSASSDISTNSKIFGSWDLKWVRKGDVPVIFEIHRPTVVFKHDGTGYIKNESSIVEKFSWQLSSSILKISHKISKESDMLIDGNYIAAIVVPDHNRLELLLTHTTKIQLYDLYK